jgi:hypothetical protein
MTAAFIAAWFGAATVARAACGSPSLSVSPGSATAGGEVTVTGEQFFRSCGIVGGSGTPERDIRVEFVEGEQTASVGIVDADTNGHFSLTVTIPSTATTGAGTIRATGSVAHAEAGVVVFGNGGTTTSSVVRSTTTTRSSTTTSSSTSSTTSTTFVEPTLPTLAPVSTFPPGSTTSTLVASGAKKGGDVTGWIVLAIVGVGVAIMTVSYFLLRATRPDNPSQP